MMLVRKAWRESRLRFVISLVTLGGFCVVVVLRARVMLDMAQAQGVTPVYSVYVWNSVYGTLIVPSMFIIGAFLLGLGGLQRERALRTAVFTLSLPVSRGQLVAARLGMGLGQVAALACVPAVVIAALSPPLIQQTYPLTEGLRFAALFFGWGAVALATGVFWSTVLTNELTAATVCVITPIPYMTLLAEASHTDLGKRFLARTEFWAADPLQFMSGANMPYLNPETFLLTGSLPWTALASLAVVTLALTALTKTITDRQNF